MKTKILEGWGPMKGTLKKRLSPDHWRNNSEKYLSTYVLEYSLRSHTFEVRVLLTSLHHSWSSTSEIRVPTHLLYSDPFTLGSSLIGSNQFTFDTLSESIIASTEYNPHSLWGGSRIKCFFYLDRNWVNIPKPCYGLHGKENHFLDCIQNEAPSGNQSVPYPNLCLWILKKKC